MPSLSSWPEVESTVYRPRLWMAAPVGAVFVLLGAGCFWARNQLPPPVPFWVLALSWLLVVAAVSTGGLCLVASIAGLLRPARVRHAAPGVLADVPTEPVVRDWLTVVHGRLGHELCETDDGWEFRPVARDWRYDKRGIIGFGVFCYILFLSLATWAFHTWAFHSERQVADWFTSALCAIVAVTPCFGLPVLFIFFGTRGGYRKLSKLTIPSRGNSLELDEPLPPDIPKTDLVGALAWEFGMPERRQLTIPRERVAAIQLCPGTYITGGKDICAAVQGLLVFTSPEGPAYHRLPLLLTCDFVGAARLMERLAGILRVPYLFRGDAAGWEAERAIAKTRPRLTADFQG